MSSAAAPPSETSDLTPMERIELHTVHVNLDASLGLLSSAIIRDDHEQVTRVTGFIDTLQRKHSLLHSQE